MITLLKKTQPKELEEFLVLVFGERNRDIAREHIATMFTTAISKQTFFIDVRGGKIIASISISEAIFTIDTWGIGWVAVHPDFRKKGIATDIIKTALNEIAQRVTKPSTAILSVYPDIAPLYEKMGFSGTSVNHEGSPFLTCSIKPPAQK